jgi:hypothetical protein
MLTASCRYVVIWTGLIMLFCGFHVFLAGNWDRE